MKPLYLIHSTEDKLYHSMAQRFCKQVSRLDAGAYHHLVLKSPGRGRNYFAEAYALLYEWISYNIDSFPIIVLDADHELRSPIEQVFEEDFDVAAVYRGPSVTDHGRHDYCAGSVFLNNKRPNIIRRFWAEWVYKTWTEKRWSGHTPQRMIDDGWEDTWMEDQAALNEILIQFDLPMPTIGIPYENKGYKIMALPKRHYGNRPKDPYGFLVHIKGSHKQRKKWVKT